MGFSRLRYLRWRTSVVIPQLRNQQRILVNFVNLATVLPSNMVVDAVHLKERIMGS